MIEVLFEGTHTNHYHEDGHYSISPLGSSVTLIQQDGVNVLFDTSSFIYEERLIEELAKRRLKPSDIHHVINSHFHLDHCFNNHLFKGTAYQHAGHATLFPNGDAHVYPDPEIRKTPDFLEMIKTPGHTGPDFSVVYKWEGETWMCVGDAVREDIIRGETRLTAAHPERFIESIHKIFERADVIVPGHGQIIQGELKDELQNLLKNLKPTSHVSD
ncbi:MAG: MBL fold metallo-hydrolase [Candidatus Peregrinibacteria bacterium]|nr:MBL fold metallo-hydrolase [Candidatus Peregrinibacteria bacterium]